MWLTHPSCKEVVRGAWNSNFDGSLASQLYNKNAKLRSDLIKWNRDVFGRVEKETFQKQKELMDIQNSIRSEDDARRESILRGDLEILMNREEMKWAQKVRNKGIVLGDRNTKYFKTLVE